MAVEPNKGTIMKKIKIALALAIAAFAVSSTPAYAACGIWGWFGYCQMQNF